MSKQVVNSPETVAPGAREGAGVVRANPEHEPQDSPPQAPAATARLPRSLSNDSKPLASEEAKPNDFERTKVGICKLSSTPVQANATLRRESAETFPCKHPPGAGAAGQAAIPHCKIPALQSTGAAAAVSPGKSTLERNNAQGAWLTLSQSTVVLGSDGNASVLPGRAEGVSWLLGGLLPAAFSSPLGADAGLKLQNRVKTAADGEGARGGRRGGLGQALCCCPGLLVSDGWERRPTAAGSSQRRLVAACGTRVRSAVTPPCPQGPGPSPSSGCERKPRSPPARVPDP